MKNKLFEIIVVAGLISADATALAQESVALPIRNRIQWLENNGYCGETSLQECALYYGIYASQAYIRGIYDPTQQNDLVELEEWQRVLGHLGLKAAYFPTARVEAPQYKVFEVWAKKQLALRRPVITTCYIAGTPPGDDSDSPQNNNPVDHIITLTSFTSPDLMRFDNDDTFVFNHHLRETTEGVPGAPAAFSQRAKWLFDTRSMKGPGAIYGYAIQKEVDYGIAITGTYNEARDARPVRVELTRIGEPNLIAGQKPVLLKAEIKVEALTPGINYVLYRYDDPAKVPLKNHEEKASKSRVAFKATSRSETFDDTIASDGVAIYRCMPVRR